jgi:hypothetical protein
MRSDELLARARRAAFIGDELAYTEYTNQVLFDEMNDRLRSVFSDAIISARSGYWLSTVVFAGNVTYGSFRIPSRAAVGGLESVEYLLNGEYYHLRELSPREAAKWEVTSSSTVTGLPVGYWLDGEKVNLVRAPQSGVTIRLRYYLRPSLLVTSQSSTSSNSGSAAAIRGRIDFVDNANKKVTVNTLPFDYSLTSPAAITTGATVDVVRPTGWHTPTIVSAVGTIVGNEITFAGLTSDEFLQGVRLNDYVRVADQTDWPALPSDFHRMLADATAANILREMDLGSKAETISTVASADFTRFAKVIQPRVKSEPKRIRQRPYWSRS